MKKLWREIGVALLLAAVMPGIMFRVALLRRQPLGETTPQTSERVDLTQERYLPVLHGEEIREMKLDDYLLGVLLQEMPASFEQEAKKAQAVVARTYALRTHEKAAKHDRGAVCTDHTCCQAYIDPETYVTNGGSREAVDAAANAIADTHDLVLMYDGELIDATYFSCSGGRTEDAAAVWGADVPYLQSVDSPGEEGVSYYTDTVYFTAQEFAQALGVSLEGLPATWFGEISRTEGGGVAAMEIGGIAYTGTQLRQKLGLRSTAFYITAVADTVTITTKGYGHRVGMSQYGAEAMAVSGKSYSEILLHYYTGAQLMNLGEATVIDKTGAV